jgi:tRNA threonylcarbamoyl adenosine modification protein YjeE
MIWQTSSTGSEDTERLGESLGSHLRGGEIIELRSDLGGGKTTFARGLVRGTGSRDRVSSPTFTLSRIYESKKFEIHHFDFYRLSEPGILADQLAEAVNNKQPVIVEWARIVENVLPDDRLTIQFEPTVLSPDERRITITYSESYRELITRLEADWKEVRP